MQGGVTGTFTPMYLVVARKTKNQAPFAAEQRAAASHVTIA
jgi:hypothetical protein